MADTKISAYGVLATLDDADLIELVDVSDVTMAPTGTNKRATAAAFWSYISAKIGAPVVLKGTWDAATGSFPGGGTAKAGWSWIVSGAGNIDGVDFTVNDRIIAIAANASVTTYAGNWHKADYTDSVTSVVGLTGAIAKANLLSALNIQDGAQVNPTNAQIVAAVNAALGGTGWQGSGGAAGTTYHNGTGATLTKGTPVALGAFNAAAGAPGMIAADADGVGTMPCLGILGADVAAGTSAVPVITGGEITGLNTSAWALGDRLYVSTGGALTKTRPSVGFIQSVAVVSRVDPAAGEIIVVLSDAGELYTEVLERAISDEVTNLSAGTAKITFRMPFPFVLAGIRANVNTAPVGAAIQVDVNVTGVGSIFSTPLTIDDGEKTSVTAAVPAVIATIALADDAEITVDIDQVGTTTPGKGLKIVMLGYRA